MKLLLLMTTLLSVTISIADDTPEDNVYHCRLFQPDSNGGTFIEREISPLNQRELVILNDGIHSVNLNWWSWTSEVQVMKEGQTVEVVGAASHEQIKLRSHSPKVSIECNRL